MGSQLPLRLELKTVMSHYVDTGNQTQALWFLETVHALLERCVTAVSPYPFFIEFMSLTHMPLAHQSVLSAAVLLPLRIPASLPCPHPNHTPRWSVIGPHPDSTGRSSGPSVFSRFSN